MFRLSAAVAWACVVVLAGCGGEERDEERPRDPGPGAGSPSAPPDAGRPAGHGADDGRVRVPDRDRTPPGAVVLLAAPSGRTLAEAAIPGADRPPSTVQLVEPRLRGTTVGRDAEGGVARVRISISERISCRERGGRATFTRSRVRYFPPPQVERVRSSPGALLRRRLTRSILLDLGGDRCGSARPVAVSGELWGEAVNGSGLEAVTPHLRFEYPRR